VIPVIAFFSGKSGVGNTTLVYHMAWKLADMGFRVQAADLDPQASLTGVSMRMNWRRSGESRMIFP
jgi:cellulose biosynthesis protein BcsQ